jgi:uncharacterized protein YaaQ
MNKMVMAVIPKTEAEAVLDALINAGHTATFTESWGGMLRQSQLTLFIAIDEKDLDKIRCIIQDNCQSEVQVEHDSEGTPAVMKTRLGGAVVFVWDLNDMTIY